MNLKLYQEVNLEQIFEDFEDGSTVGLVDIPDDSDMVVVIPQGQNFPIRKSTIPRVDFDGAELPPPPPEGEEPPPPPEGEEPPPPGLPIPQRGQLNQKYNVIMLTEGISITN